jgi:hypothetical protein
MTCFWRGLIRQLTVDDFNRAFKIKHKPDYKEFVKLLIRFNTKPINVKHNGVALSEQQIDEALQHIATLDVKKLGKGYLCSSCDPVIMLVAQLFTLSINHDYNGFVQKYTVDGTVTVRELNLCSNVSHMF